VEAGRIRPALAVFVTASLTMRFLRTTVVAVVRKHASLAGTCGMGGRFRSAAGCRRRRSLSRPWNHGWKIMVTLLVWFEWVKRLETAGKQSVFRKKQKPRRLRERAGFEKGNRCSFRFLNYPPAILGLLPK
jgi:hypothetical protein